MCFLAEDWVAVRQLVARSDLAARVAGWLLVAIWLHSAAPFQNTEFFLSSAMAGHCDFHPFMKSTNALCQQLVLTVAGS